MHRHTVTHTLSLSLHTHTLTRTLSLSQNTEVGDFKVKSELSRRSDFPLQKLRLGEIGERKFPGGEISLVARSSLAFRSFFNENWSQSYKRNRYSLKIDFILNLLSMRHYRSNNSW